MEVDDPRVTRNSEQIRDALIAAIRAESPSPVRLVSEAVGVTRQAINRHLQGLIKTGVVVATGKTKSRAYALATLVEEHWRWPLDGTLEEDVIWRDQVRPKLGSLRTNALAICQFGFTEVLNNAIDHSEGQWVRGEARMTAADLTLRIHDDGVGAFAKVERAFGFGDAQQAVLELTKGKLTTDPKRHSGEGLFFASRAFDSFVIDSGENRLHVDQVSGTWRLHPLTPPVSGTRVEMTLALNTRHELRAVFDQFAAPDEFRFDRTQVPVYLAQYGDENLISRSQARRLLHRLDQFQDVLFDFKDVAFIGQGFADEIFRVFQNEHPAIRLRSVNASADIARMISHVRPAES